MRLYIPALTYSWNLHGFPLEWEPCCFPGSSSIGETTCPSPVDNCMASLFNGSLAASMATLPEVRLLVPGLTYSWHLPGFPLSLYLSQRWVCRTPVFLKIFLLFSWVEERQWIQSSNQTRDCKITNWKVWHNYLKIPKCEIFHPFDSCRFYTIMPLWIGNFGTEIKNSKFFCLVKILFCSCWVCTEKNYFVCCKFGQKLSLLLVTFELICMCQKHLF